MLHSIMLSLHILSVVVWVGGMFFAYMALRPVAATLLQPPQRLPLWSQVFGKFFPWVWLAIILILVTGYWMIFNVYGGMKTAPLYIHLMNGLGIVMMLIYLHVFFAPRRRLDKAVAAQDWQAGGKALGQIRMLIGINMMIGLIVVVIAGGGRFLAM
jgi:uncharacterized membrane protein